MYTRCIACHTVHPVNAGLLARNGGRYRCGKCRKVSNALDSLFDEWPGAGERPAKAGELPVLGLSIDLDQARESILTPDEARLYGDSDQVAGPRVKRGKWLVRLSWITMAVVLAAVVTFKLLDFHQAPFPDLPIVEKAMIRLGMQSPPVLPPYRDLQQIHLVSRELASHPFRPDMLRLTATLVNRAPETQPFPVLEIILLDSQGLAISQQRFSPADYLIEGAATGSGMTPEAYLPLVLDLPDPGQLAVGFELNFL